jgi:hypothetical protein
LLCHRASKCCRRRLIVLHERALYNWRPSLKVTSYASRLSAFQRRKSLTRTPEQKLYSIDLTKQFDVDVLLSSTAYQTAEVPSDSNWQANGAFFLDATSSLLYSYGGFLTDYPALDTIPLYNTTSKQWSAAAVSGGKLNQGARGGAAYASSLTTDKGYNVTATGQIPNTRDEMCSVVSYAADGSSANILLYGGWSLLDGRGWQDIYVLSVPSFQWILVNASGHADAKGQEIGHGNMRCHLHGERNMVVVGGTWNQANHEVNDVACNPSYPSVRALDTSSMTWYKTWPGASNAKYEVPQAVYNVIGGK